MTAHTALWRSSLGPPCPLKRAPPSLRHSLNALACHARIAIVTGATGRLGVAMTPALASPDAEMVSIELTNDSVEVESLSGGGFRDM